MSVLKQQSKGRGGKGEGLVGFPISSLSQLE